MISYLRMTSLLLADPLAGFVKTSCHVGETHVAKNSGWPPLKSQQGTENLSPNPFKKQNPANNRRKLIISQ